jgi:hypothetical protein
MAGAPLQRSPQQSDVPARAPADRGLSDHPLLALQRTAGNAAIAQKLARKAEMPLDGGVPAGAKYTTLVAFLDVIRTEEAKLPPAEQTNTKLMVTRLRKLFYGSKAWDKYLIPEAADVKPLYTFEEKETKREEVEIKGAPNIDHVTKESRLVDAPEVLKDPASIQEVKMPDGKFVDVGHVLAGLDAANNPSVAGDQKGVFPMYSNMAAVTWLGDLGSIAGELIINAVKAGKSSYTEADLQNEITRMAPSQDMLGNVDAYAMEMAFDAKATSGKKVSDMLAEFYGAPGAATNLMAKYYRETRFTTFAISILLGDLKGSTFEKETEFKAYWLPQLRNSTTLYTGSATDSHTTGIGAASWAGFMSGAGKNNVNVALLDMFVDALRPKVAAEAPIRAAYASVPTAP